MVGPSSQGTLRPFLDNKQPLQQPPSPYKECEIPSLPTDVRATNLPEATNHTESASSSQEPLCDPSEAAPVEDRQTLRESMPAGSPPLRRSNRIRSAPNQCDAAKGAWE